jgi:HSP20 family protein
MPVITLRDLGALDNLFGTEMDRLVGNMFGANAGHASLAKAAARVARRDGGPFPRVNLFESPNGFEVVAQLPGVAANQLEVVVHKDLLVIRGVRQLPEPEGARALRRERARGEFERTIQLPTAVATDRVEAALKDGFLRVALPKSPDAQPRRVEIKAL